MYMERLENHFRVSLSAVIIGTEQGCIECYFSIRGQLISSLSQTDVVTSGKQI